jgi:hypothetical protein
MIKYPSFKKFGIYYLAYKNRFRKNYILMDKIWSLIAITVFITAISIYWYFINIASTKWYFINIEKKKLNEIKFQNEIVKIDIRKLEWALSNSILTFNNLNNLTWTTIILTYTKEIAYNNH